MKKICVMGSINVDLTISIPRFHAPGETIEGTNFATFTGGKGGNQAIAAARLGADVTLVGAIGEDDFGRSYLETFRKEGVNPAGVAVVPGVSTGTALIGAPPKRSRDFHRQDEAPPPPSPRFNTGAAARDASRATPASPARRRARPSGGRDAGDSIARRLGGASARPPHQKNQTGRRGGAAAPQLLMRDAPFIPATANEKKGEGQPLTLPTGTILPPVRRSSRRHTGHIPAPWIPSSIPQQRPVEHIRG